MNAWLLILKFTRNQELQSEVTWSYFLEETKLDFSVVAESIWFALCFRLNTFKSPNLQLPFGVEGTGDRKSWYTSKQSFNKSCKMIPEYHIPYQNPWVERYGYSRRYDNAMVKYKNKKCSNKLPVPFSFIFNLKLFHTLLIILNYCFFFPWLKFKSL